MSVDHEYEDEFYESSDLDMIHFDEDYENQSGNNSNALPRSTIRNKRNKKKRSLEDWLEEKRLRDQLKNDPLDN